MLPRDLNLDKMDKELLQLAEIEQIERKNQNKLISVTQEILTLKKRINEEKAKLPILEENVYQLKKICNTLGCELRLCKESITILKQKHEANLETLDTENKALEKAQNQVCNDIIEFNTRARQNGNGNDFGAGTNYSRINNRQKEIDSLRKDVLELDCKLRARNQILKFQKTVLDTVASVVDL
ncbi:hypothetical protein FQA39_LY07642 [Lamprigera yunnana]|nr:hypothetical protein FQA39_LY07642 [Lamprigera yunnana]